MFFWKKVALQVAPIVATELVYLLFQYYTPRSRTRRPSSPTRTRRKRTIRYRSAR